MKRRVLAAMLSMVLAFGSSPVFAEEAGAAETVYEAEEESAPEAGSVYEAENVYDAENASEEESVSETEINAEKMAAEEPLMSGNCGDNAWFEFVMQANGTEKLVITGEGPLRTNYYGHMPWYLEKARIHGLEIQEGITEIPEAAFEGCMYIETVDLPDTITRIGKRAFSFCDNLREIHLSEGLEVIEPYLLYASGIKSVTVPDGVKSIGDFAFSECSLESAVLPEGLPEIGIAVFQDNPDLKTVTIPKSVRTIEIYAFDKCPSLTHVEYGGSPEDWNRIEIKYNNDDLIVAYKITNGIPLEDEEYTGSLGSNLTYTMKGNPVSGYLLQISGTGEMNMDEGNPWFSKFRRITELEIQEGVTGVCGYAFNEYPRLTVVSLPKSMKTIHENAFYGNPDTYPIQEVHYAGSQEDWEKITFDRGNDDFRRIYYSCNQVTPPITVKQGVCGTDSVSYILTGNLLDGYTLVISGEGEIYDFDSDESKYAPWDSEKQAVREIEIEDGITKIGSYAFAYCSSLRRVSIADSVTAIGENAFAGCSELAEIRIPADVTEIGAGAFTFCEKLTELVLPAGVTKIRDSLCSNCTGLKKITIPEGVRSVGMYAFLGCSGLEELNLPESVTGLGSDVFHDCRGLKSVIIPEHLTYIPMYSFYGCSGLTSIVIPDSVANIYLDAFSGCNNLKDVYYFGDEASWQAIKIQELNDCLTEAEIHYDFSLPCVIQLQPMDVHADLKDKVVFRVKARYAASYQWEYSKDGVSWKSSSISSAVTDTLSLTAATTNKDNLYRCRITGRDKEIYYSDTVLLDVNLSPVILMQPEDVRACLGSKISFSVKGKNATSYQWQYSKDGVSWKNSTVKSASTETISLTLSESNKSNCYRCKLTGTDGSEVYTETAGIEVVLPVSISQQPETVAAAIGEQVTYTVVAENAYGGYQWYYSKDGIKWSRSTVSSAAGPSITMKLTETNKGNLYRCTVTGLDGGKENSDICGAVVVSRQPKDIAVDTGKSGSFTVEAEGIASYQWQYSKDLVKWSVSTISSAGSNQLTVKASDTTRQNSYRCALTGENGLVAYTDPVRLLESCIVISKQPTDVSAEVGAKIRFTVEAENVASWQWQYSKDGVSWKNSSITSAATASVSLTVSDSNKGNLYRCKLTGTDGTVKYTEAVRISN